jgi:hypothetical protein
MDSKQNNSQLSSQADIMLPPDQAMHVVMRQGMYCLLSISNDPISLGIGKGSFPFEDFSLYNFHVCIFAESIIFPGDLLAPHGISLSCNMITIQKPVKINSTGANGDDQNKAKQTEAQVGHDAGLINFYIQSGSDNVSKCLLFVANRGKGGDAVIENAQGGNGGSGGYSVRIFKGKYLRSPYL